MTTVARMTSPADIAAAIPEVLGFVPTESLVVLSLHEPRGRVGLTMRFDLSAAEVLVEAVPPRLAQDEATRAVLVVFTAEPGPLPREQVVTELIAAVEAAGPRVTEALLVRDGRWSSYVCRQSCCPVEGSPVPASDRGPAGLIAAERVWQGWPLLGSRAELAASIRPVLPLGEPVRAAQLDAVAEELERELLVDSEAALQAGLALLRRVLAEPRALDDAAAARCVLWLEVMSVRDEVLSWCVEQAAAVRALALALCRRTPSADACQVLTVLGAAAYVEGGGALAAIALEAAIATGGNSGMAGLLLRALDGQLPPAEIRRTLTASRRLLGHG